MSAYTLRHSHTVVELFNPRPFAPYSVRLRSVRDFKGLFILHGILVMAPPKIGFSHLGTNEGIYTIP